MKKVKYVDIVLENCEVFRVSPKSIESITINNIQRYLGINCFQYKNGEIYENISTDKVIIKLKNFSKIKDITKFPTNLNFLERINYIKDITHLDLNYDDGTKEYITVPWDEHENYNDWQNNKIDKNWKDEDILTIIIEEK